jgi:16S rRNA (guanine527-N7)-methyltransferase
MRPERIAELLQPFLSIASPCKSPAAEEEPHLLSSAQLEYISTYIDILLRWNSRINLTTIRNPEEIITRHFGESFFAARHLFPTLAGSISTAAPETGFARVADLGSGAGFPGVPIKIWAPCIALTLIESNHKKAAFLREVSRALTLTDVDIQNARAETLASSMFDVVTLRAVERLADVLPTAGSLLNPSGRLALLISSSQVQEVQAALPTFSWDPAIPVPGSQSRILLVSAHKQLREEL